MSRHHEKNKNAEKPSPIQKTPEMEKFSQDKCQGSCNKNTPKYPQKNL